MVESSRAKETEKRERRGGTSRAGLLPHLASLTTDVDGILSSPRADAALSGSCREHYRLIAIMHDEQLGRERDNAFRRREEGEEEEEEEVHTLRMRSTLSSSYDSSTASFVRYLASHCSSSIISWLTIIWHNTWYMIHFSSCARAYHNDPS